MTESVLINEINSIVKNGLKDRPIVIWYDEGETLSGIIDETIPDGTNFIHYTGSYLAIRQKVEESDSHLKQKWFIYIGKKRRNKSWLRDYELFGECIEYNLERLLVERLGLKSTSETKKILFGHKGRLLADNWDSVIRNDINIEQMKNGLLAAIFKFPYDFDIKRAILDYLTIYDRFVDELSFMGVHGLFNDKIVEYLGIDCLKNDIVDPDILASALLLSEFVESSDGEGEIEFSGIIPPKDKRSYAVNLVKDWTNNTELIDGFFEYSDIISKKYNIRYKLDQFKKLLNVISFEIVDEILLEDLITRINVDSFEEHVDTALKISETRRKMIWSKEGKINYWDKIYLASKLFKLIQIAREKVEVNNTFDEFIQEYTSESGWWKIDDTYLKMAACSENIQLDIKNYIIKPTSMKYGEWLKISGVKVSESVSRLDKWESQNAYPQQNFWMENVSIDDGKIAVIYIDALRYDLAKKLYFNLEKRKFKVSMKAMLSSLPSITEVGMAALLPKNEDMSIEVENGKLKTIIKDSSVYTKNLRKEWIHKALGDVIFIDLKDINESPTIELVKMIKDSNRIFIMDREIDKLGTFISDITVTFFESLVDEIAMAVENLHKAGIKKVIVGTDHGFILLPEELELDSIPVSEINNETYKGKRFLIGQPPVNDNFLTFDYSSLGYNSRGKVEFPRSIYPLSKRGSKFMHGGISLQENCIASIKSIKEVTSEKIGVKVEIPDTITSAIFRVTISPKFETLTSSEREVKVQICVEDILLEESKAYILYKEPITVRLVLRKLPKNVEIIVKDTETDEILFCKLVPVELEGYDDII